jgi:transcriptional regulator with XRE-family HTH domain
MRAAEPGGAAPMPARPEPMAITPPAPTFGQLLRHFRLTTSLSQEKLAERAGLSVEAVNTLERGKRRSPRMDTVARLAQALHLSPADRERLEAGSPAPVTPPPKVSRSVPCAWRPSSRP